MTMVLTRPTKPNVKLIRLSPTLVVVVEVVLVVVPMLVVVVALLVVVGVPAAMLSAHGLLSLVPTWR